MHSLFVVAVIIVAIALLPLALGVVGAILGLAGEFFEALPGPLILVLLVLGQLTLAVVLLWVLAHNGIWERTLSLTDALLALGMAVLLIASPIQLLRSVGFFPKWKRQQ